MKKARLTPIVAALGTTLAVSLSASPMANAAGNPFSMNELSSGYMVAADAEGTCGDMGGDPAVMDEEAADEEAAGGTETKTEPKAATKAEEGKCGEGKCGEKRKAHEGKCGADNKK